MRMTRRDLRWRLTGAALTCATCALAATGAGGRRMVFAYFIAAIVGLVLVLHGKRVAVACRAEWRGHGRTAETIHVRRVSGSREHAARPGR